jgi:hypothetical protein
MHGNAVHAPTCFASQSFDALDVGGHSITLTGANSGRPSPMNCTFAVFCAVSASGAVNPV